ncbi:HNH endonuclease [Roseibium sp. MB-4]
MADRYLPALAMFSLDENEQSAITEALTTADPWGWQPGGAKQAAITAAKEKIRDYHLSRHRSRCCYCRVNLQGAGPFMTDREHVLPKSIPEYRSLSYTMWNLGIACKRCNMEYKKNKSDFVVAPGNVAALVEADNYRFIHPNFDLYSEHLERSSVEANDTVIVKYTVSPDSPKGAFTYDYFNLRGLEVGSFDDAQGVHKSENLSKGALEVQALADQYGQ